MSEKQTKCVNIGQGIVFRCCWILKQLFSILLFVWNIIFEQQKIMLGAVNLGKSYQNTGQFLVQEKGNFITF